jgi:hypothetical protein
MPYTPFYPGGWEDDPSTDTPISADALQNMEDGIATAQSTAEDGSLTTADAWAAKGDLIAGTGVDTAAILSAGANDEVPVYDSAQSTGLKKAKIVNANVDAAAAIARTKLAAATTRVPIQLHTPRASSLAGNSFWSVLGLTNYDLGHWEFLKDVEGYVYGSVIVPTNVAATPNAKVILLIAANATTGVTRLQVATAPPADGETVNASFTTETAQDITVPGTAYLRKDVEFDLTNDPAAEDLLLVSVFHDGDHANDTLAVNTLLLGAYLEVDIA